MSLMVGTLYHSPNANAVLEEAGSLDLGGIKVKTIKNCNLKVLKDEKGNLNFNFIASLKDKPLSEDKTLGPHKFSKDKYGLQVNFSIEEEAFRTSNGSNEQLQLSEKYDAKDTSFRTFWNWDQDNIAKYEYAFSSQVTKTKFKVNWNYKKSAVIKVSIEKKGQNIKFLSLELKSNTSFGPLAMNRDYKVMCYDVTEDGDFSFLETTAEK